MSHTKFEHNWTNGYDVIDISCYCFRVFESVAESARLFVCLLALYRPQFSTDHLDILHRGRYSQTLEAYCFW